MPCEVTNKDQFHYGGFNRYVPEGPAQLFTQHIYHLINDLGEAARRKFEEVDGVTKRITK